jgi:MobA/MobL family
VAIYHLHVKNISRRDGRSAVAAAAYRAGETLPNEAEEKDSAFAGKRDVVFTEIRLPPDAPAWMSDRAKLWNAVEAAEKRKDARLAKEIEFSLPRELARSVWIDVAREMADAYVTRGHVVDLAIHEDGSGHNPHVHLMLATRTVGADGLKLKLRDADGVAFVTEARETWAKIANAALGKAGAGVEIDARSHAARGIEKQPTVHRGPNPAERRARRWGIEMNHDMLEVRRELLSERDTRERFPLLSGRPDWPPERRDPVPGLSPGEAAEWASFWREVDKRMWGEELHPAHPTDNVAIEPRDPIQVGKLLDKLTDEVRAGAAVREVTLEDALPVWRELHAAMIERMRADGHRTDDPLSDWTHIEKSLRDFDERLTQLRLQEAERRSYEPVPDPDGRSIHPRELADEQERVLFESRKPAASTPRPERMPAGERADARAAVDRQNAIDVPDRDADAYRLAPHESRLDWLDEQKIEPFASTRDSLEDRLDWLESRHTAKIERTDRDRDR